MRDLRLSNTRLNNKSLGDLADFHTNHKFQLLHLDISSNHFTMEGVVKLLNSLKGNQILRKLNLARNDLSTGDLGYYHSSVASAFEQFISLNRSLEELNLNDCKLGPDGALVLGKSLRRNQRLQKLSVN